MIESNADNDPHSYPKYEDKVAKSINSEIFSLSRPRKHSLEIGKVDVPNEISSTIYDKMRKMIAEKNSRHDDWGFKDPRTIYTYPFWEKVLPPHKILAVRRSPHEVWSHYSIKRKLTSNHFLFGTYRGLIKIIHRWCEWQKEIDVILDKTDSEFLEVSYRAIMESNEELDKIGHFIGREVVDCREARWQRAIPKNKRLIDLLLVFYGYRKKFSGKRA